MMEWMLLAALAPSEGLPREGIATEHPAGTLKIDILVKPLTEKCDTQASDEIVVCADKSYNESQRIRPIANADIYEKDESKADFGLSENVRMAAEVESEELGAGITSKRIMARMKVKF
jgi:hypothetical protein